MGTVTTVIRRAAGRAAGRAVDTGMARGRAKVADMTRVVPKSSTKVKGIERTKLTTWS